MLKFNRTDNRRQVWINPFAVTAVEEMSGGGCQIYTGKHGWAVRESAEEVIAQIEKELIQATRPPLSAFA